MTKRTYVDPSFKEAVVNTFTYDEPSAYDGTHAENAETFNHDVGKYVFWKAGLRVIFGACLGLGAPLFIFFWFLSYSAEKFSLGFAILAYIFLIVMMWGIYGSAFSMWLDDSDGGDYPSV